MNRLKSIRYSVRKWLSALLLLSVGSYLLTYASAQTFNYTYDVNGRPNSATSLTKAGASMFVADLAYCPDRPIECLCLSKFGAAGSHEWTKTYDLHPPYQHRAGGWNSLTYHNNELILVGDEELRPDYHRFFISFWDTTGVLVDTVFFDFEPSHDNSFVRGVLAFDDNTFFVYGNEKVNDSIPTLFLSKISRSGEESWRRNFGAEEIWLPDPENLLLLTDSTLLLVGTEKYGDVENGRRILLIHTDLDGNTISIDFPESEFDATYIRSEVDLLPGGDLVYAFARDSVMWPFYNLVVRRIDPDLQTVWADTIDYRFQTLFNDIMVSSTGSIYLIGQTFVLINEEVKISPWLVKYSNDGERLWERAFQHPYLYPDRRSEIYDMAEQDDHLFIIGRVRDTTGTGEENANSWVVRLDTNGQCVGDACPVMMDLYSAVHAPPPTALDLWLAPNPASDFLMLSGESMADCRYISLFDMNGRLLKHWRTEYEDESQSFPLHDVPKGTYIVVAWDERGQVGYREKLIVVGKK